jgi:hypothetical protein
MKRQSRNCFDLLPAERSQSCAFNMECVDRHRRSEYENHACARRDARGSGRQCREACCVPSQTPNTRRPTRMGKWLLHPDNPPSTGSVSPAGQVRHAPVASLEAVIRWRERALR